MTEEIELTPEEELDKLENEKSMISNCFFSGEKR